MSAQPRPLDLRGAVADCLHRAHYLSCESQLTLGKGGCVEVRPGTTSASLRDLGLVLAAEFAVVLVAGPRPYLEVGRTIR